MEEKNHAFPAEESVEEKIADDEPKYRHEALNSATGLSPEEMSDFNNFPLHFAIRTLDDPDELYNKCKFLLDKGNDVNQINSPTDTITTSRLTPLHYLFFFKSELGYDNYEKVFDLLLERGADVNFRDGTGYTALHFAMSYDNYKLTEKFLKLGANPNNGHNSLMASVLVYPANINHVESAKLLLDFDADGSDIQVVLGTITQGDNVEVLQLIVERCTEFKSKILSQTPPRMRGPRNDLYTALIHLCIERQAANSLQVLLENGVDIEVYNNSFSNPCMLSVAYLKYQKLVADTDSDPDSKRNHRIMVQSIIEHLAIMDESDLENSKIGMRQEPWIEKEFQRYARQTQLMRKTLISENSDVTYIDLLIEQGQSLVDCCNDDIILSISAEKIHEMFPDYLQKLRRRIRVGISQRTSRSYVPMLYEIFKSKLPVDLLYPISDFLKASEMNEPWLKIIDSKFNDVKIAPTIFEEIRDPRILCRKIHLFDNILSYHTRRIKELFG